MKAYVDHYGNPWKFVGFAKGKIELEDLLRKNMLRKQNESSNHERFYLECMKKKMKCPFRGIYFTNGERESQLFVRNEHNHTKETGEKSPNISDNGFTVSKFFGGYSIIKINWLFINSRYSFSRKFENSSVLFR